jgi:hypothetical protein
MLTCTPEKRDEDNPEKVLVRLIPRALHKPYIEITSLSKCDSIFLSAGYPPVERV